MDALTLNVSECVILTQKLFQMDFLENVAQKEGAITEVEAKQESNQELNKEEFLGTECKYENNHTVVKVKKFLMRLAMVMISWKLF